MTRHIVDPEEAIAMLPDGESIHTFRNSAAGVLIGADWPREDIVTAIRENQCELAGEMATSMNHGLIVHTGGPLFVETKKP